MIYARRRRRGLIVWLTDNSIYVALVALVLLSLFVGAFACYNITSFEKKMATAEAIQPHVTIVEFSVELEALAPIEPPLEEVIIEEVQETFYFDVPLSHELQDYIRELCEEYDVPMELVIAMIEIESGYRSDIVSKTSDYGLMQINTVNHKRLRSILGVTDFLDPFQNVLCGIYMISGHLVDTDGNVELALMQYNRGPAGALELWNEGVYSIPYSRMISELYKTYKEKAAHGGATP